MNTPKQNFRYLIVAMVTSHKNPINDSGFFVAMHIAKSLAKNGNYCYVVLPEQCGEPENFKQLPKIKGIKYVITGISSMLFDQAHSVVDTQVLNDLFSMQGGKYFLDAAIVFSGEHAMQIRCVISHHTSVMTDFPIYNIELGMNAPDTNPSYAESMNEKLHAMGFAITTPVMATDREKSVMEDKMLHYGLGSRARQDAVDRTISAAQPVDFETLDEYRAKFPRGQEPENPTLNLLYAARINSVKRVEKIIDAFDEVYRQAVPCTVTLMSNTPAFKSEIFLGSNKVLEERDYITTKFKAGRAEFYTAAATSHVYVMWSTSEVFPIALMEAMYLGCIPQIERSTWAQHALKDWDDPLFWFDNKNELVTNIRWIQQNWAEAEKRLYALLDKITPYFKEHELSLEIMRDMQAKYEGDFWMPHTMFGMKKEFEDLMQRVALKGEYLNPLYITPLFNDFLRGSMSKDCLVRAATKRLPTDYHYYYWLKYMYKQQDDCSRGMSRFNIDFGGKAHGTKDENA
ncbi:glycosyltransferase [Vibrio phage V-YDF132]|nr:glycosyltransferase [Vibrio phage V-YDF132]